MQALIQIILMTLAFVACKSTSNSQLNESVPQNTNLPLYNNDFEWLLANSELLNKANRSLTYCYSSRLTPQLKDAFEKAVTRFNTLSASHKMNWTLTISSENGGGCDKNWSLLEKSPTHPNIRIGARDFPQAVDANGKNEIDFGSLVSFTHENLDTKSNFILYGQISFNRSELLKWSSKVGEDEDAFDPELVALHGLGLAVKLYAGPSRPSSTDSQIVPCGHKTVAPNTTIISATSNTKLTASALGDDQVTADTINSGANGIAESGIASGIMAPMISKGSRCINPTSEDLYNFSAEEITTLFHGSAIANGP